MPRWVQKRYNGTPLVLVSYNVSSVGGCYFEYWDSWRYDLHRRGFFICKHGNVGSSKATVVKSKTGGLLSLSMSTSAASPSDSVHLS